MGSKKITTFLTACGFAITLAAAGSAFAMELSGKVAETMNSGGYTYILLENEGGKAWAAIPETKLAVGDKVELQPGMVMENFTSKTLNRTFEEVLFSGGLMK